MRAVILLSVFIIANAFGEFTLTDGQAKVFAWIFMAFAVADILELAK